MAELFDLFARALGSVLENPIVGLSLRAAGLYLVALWLASSYWVYRDLGQRTKGLVAPYLGAAFVLLFGPLFFVFGLVLYRIVRPPETLLEAAEREGLEQASLAEADVGPCPECGRPTHRGWLVCPGCGQRLARRCDRCDGLVELDWDLCAWCGSDFRPPRPVTLAPVAGGPIGLPVEAGGDGGRPAVAARSARRGAR
ncbi:MAG TPA: zinc ribbon domain-containing protein [Candidatus Limnocylindrales bacterium]|nr:zinc ribbon domain-containing protein [Candidatus Limnocylindrales bacterium]